MRVVKAATEETGPMLGPELVEVAAAGAVAGVEMAIMC
jgi:hypothetical protein